MSLQFPREQCTEALWESRSPPAIFQIEELQMQPETESVSRVPEESEKRQSTDIRPK